MSQSLSAVLTYWLSPAVAAEDLVTDLPGKILSQCGLVSGLLVAAVVYLASQLAKTRAAWESDRSGMAKLIESQNVAYEKLAVSSAKLEGIVLSLQVRGAGD